MLELFLLFRDNPNNPLFSEQATIILLFVVINTKEPNIKIQTSK